MTADIPAVDPDGTWYITPPPPVGLVPRSSEPPTYTTLPVADGWRIVRSTDGRVSRHVYSSPYAARMAVESGTVTEWVRLI